MKSALDNRMEELFSKPKDQFVSDTATTTEKAD